MTAPISTPSNLQAKVKLLTTLVILVAVVAVVAPITVYWVIERNDMHQRWDLQATYSQWFLFHTEYAAALVNGTISPWNNDTVTSVSSELAYADSELYNLQVLDTSHANQLSRISYAIETLRTDNYLQDLNQSARTTLASQLRPLSHKLANAYWNYINYTSSGTGVGPSFWYSGPSPPDEQLLQDAVNIALSFERK